MLSHSVVDAQRHSTPSYSGPLARCWHGRRHQWQRVTGASYCGTSSTRSGLCASASTAEDRPATCGGSGSRHWTPWHALAKSPGGAESALLKEPLLGSRLNRVSVRVLLALILTAALALIGAGQVTTSQARQMASHECGSPVTIRSAPWTMGIQDSIGVRVKHGTTYFLRAGDSGPPCGVARKKLAHIAKLRTRQAIRAASFGGLHCGLTHGTPMFSGYARSAPGPVAGHSRPTSSQGATSSGN
jgi:hypothetical protein